MIRLLGSITGSALAIALLLLFVGLPQFRAPEDDIERTVMTLPLPTRPVEPLAEDINEPVAEIESAGPDIVAAREADVSADEMEPDLLVIEASHAAGEPTTIMATPPPPRLPAPGINIIPQWHSFWSPFRSEIAANGFVDRLQSVTGLDYRIQRIKPGVYEVSFAYVDDAEIAGSLSLITAATGLELGDR